MFYFIDVEQIDFTALRAGRPDAWRDFLRQCDPLLHAITAWPKWRFDAHAREEVVQATRTSLAQSLPTLTCNAAIPAFVRRICANRCIDAVRRRVREREHFVPLTGWGDDDSVADHPADDSYDPVREIVLAERAASLRLAMNHLDPACQTAIREFYVEQRSYKAMAERQNVAVNTVGSRLSRCLDKLRTLLGELTT